MKLKYDSVMKKFGAHSIFLIYIANLIFPNQASASTLTTFPQFSSAYAKVNDSIIKVKNELKINLMSKDREIQNIEDKLKQDTKTISLNFQEKKLQAIDSANSALQTLQKSSVFIVQVSNLSRCNGLCGVGEVLVIPYNVDDIQFQKEVDYNLTQGALTPQNKTAYEAARVAFKQAKDLIAELDINLQQDLSEIRLAASDLKNEVEENYVEKKFVLSNKLNFQKEVMGCIERFSRSKSNFRKGFKTAIEFELNLKALKIAAETPIVQLKDYLEIKKAKTAVTKYIEGKKISENFSIAKAEEFNSSLNKVYLTQKELSRYLTKVAVLLKE